MSDGETFRVELGGKAWDVPHLPFRAIKAIQPALYGFYVSAGGAAMTSDTIARLSEADLDRLADAIWRTVSAADPALTFADFLDLPFSVSDLIRVFPAVAKAVGLRPASSEAAPDAGKAPL